jgi:hypothetical protein
MFKIYFVLQSKKPFLLTQGGDHIVAYEQGFEVDAEHDRHFNVSNV